jgi:tRNA threonylcarbamoyl adenosine modification protein YeaZ
VNDAASRDDGRGRPAARLLAIDTALSRAVVALGEQDGTFVDEVTWVAGHRHGEELLTRLQGLLQRNETALDDLGAIVSGTGPGAFTGLRVGIATAKALAHGLGVPIVGVSTAAALLAAVLPAAGLPADGLPVNGSESPEPSPTGVLLPAGPSDRVLVVGDGAELLPAGTEPPGEIAPDQLVAVDLPGRAAPAALARGDRAAIGLGAALLRLGAARLAGGAGDDLARLVPQYVTPPRGVARERGEVAWSRGPR